MSNTLERRGSFHTVKFKAKEAVYSSCVNICFFLVAVHVKNVGPLQQLITLTLVASILSFIFGFLLSECFVILPCSLTIQDEGHSYLSKVFKQRHSHVLYMLTFLPVLIRFESYSSILSFDVDFPLEFLLSLVLRIRLIFVPIFDYVETQFKMQQVVVVRNDHSCLSR